MFNVQVKPSQDRSLNLTERGDFKSTDQQGTVLLSERKGFQLYGRREDLDFEVFP
jgi:hypothetical protein